MRRRGRARPAGWRWLDSFLDWVGLCRRGRARPAGWRRLFLDRELRGGWESGAMHGRLHPASISTRAAATLGGAQAAAVVHGAVVGRRSIGRRDGRLRSAFALPSIHPRGQSPRPRIHPLSLSRTLSPSSSHARRRGPAWQTALTRMAAVSTSGQGRGHGVCAGGQDVGPRRTRHLNRGGRW